MRDLSRQVPALSLPSMGAGNTIDDPIGHQLAMTAPGSESVNRLPTALDLSPLPVIPAGRDRTVLLGDGGEPVSAAVDQDRTDGGWRMAGGYQDQSAGGWRPC